MAILNIELMRDAAFAISSQYFLYCSYSKYPHWIFTITKYFFIYDDKKEALRSGFALQRDDFMPPISHAGQNGSRVRDQALRLTAD